MSETSNTEPYVDGFGSCPMPVSERLHVLLGHGSGGKLSAELVRRLFLPAFDNATLSALEDQAIVDFPADNCSLSESWPNDGVAGQSPIAPRLAFTTDSFVVKPLFFPGGDIGKLAIHGTVNDLAVGGANPLYLSAAFILEEGFPLETLAEIVRSMREACREAGVTLVAGDTKVVDRGKGDQVFITTSGIGMVPPGRQLSIRNARPGDKLIVSGTLGDHGIAIMSVREGIEFETVLESDSASLHDLTRVMLECCPDIRCMRDPTRGGLSSSLNELAEAANVGIKLDESAIPLRVEVRAACEMLGLDPLYVANEGKLVAVVPQEQANDVLDTMRRHALGRHAAIVGEVVADHPRLVVMRSILGGERVVTMLAGEQLPRIC